MPEDVDDWIRIAYCEKPGWWSSYGLEDQLAAIAALGQSRSLKALCVVRAIYDSVPAVTRRTRQGFQGVDTVMDEWDVEVRVYPNARGQLGAELAWEVCDLSSSHWGSETRHTDQDIEKARTAAVPPSNRAHVTLRTALAELRAALEHMTTTE